MFVVFRLHEKQKVMQRQKEEIKYKIFSQIHVCFFTLIKCLELLHFFQLERDFVS